MLDIEMFHGVDELCTCFNKNEPGGVRIYRLRCSAFEGFALSQMCRCIECALGNTDRTEVADLGGMMHV